jgi:hypothetical protein
MVLRRPERGRSTAMNSREDPMIGRLRTRDPWWDDGRGARKTHRRVRIEGFIALSIAIVACGVTVALWLRTLAPLANGLHLG